MDLARAGVLLPAAVLAERGAPAAPGRRAAPPIRPGVGRQARLAWADSPAPLAAKQAPAGDRPRPAVSAAPGPREAKAQHPTSPRRWSCS